MQNLRNKIVSILNRVLLGKPKSNNHSDDKTSATFSNIIDEVKANVQAEEAIHFIPSGDPLPSSETANESNLRSVQLLFRKSLIGNEIFVHRMENSILNNPYDYEPYEVAGRKRLACCSGVSWFEDHLLALCNVYGGHVRICKLTNLDKSDEKISLEILHHFNNGIAFPDDVAVSVKNNMLAVTHSMAKDKGVSLHYMDRMTLEPQPAFEHLRKTNTGHGTHFSPDSKFLAFTTIDGPGTIEVYDVSFSPVLRVCIINNQYQYLKPKGICFTPDSKYVAVIYSEPLSPKYIKRKITGKRLSIHQFDANTGIINEQSLVSLEEDGPLVSCFELCAFRNHQEGDDYRLYITNQALDKVIEVVFNPGIPSIHIAGVQGKNLSFPHGIDISPNGKHLAVTNFGDDTLRIFELLSPLENKEPGIHVLLCGHTAKERRFGAERSFIDLVTALSSLGYKVSCLIPEDTVEYTNELADFADAVFKLPFDYTDHTNPSDERIIALIVNLIKKEGISLVHVNSALVPFALTAARRAGIPGILHMRELLLEDKIIAGIFKQPGMLTLNQLIAASDFIIANSNATRLQFTSSDNIDILYNSVDTARFDLPSICIHGKLKVGMISDNSVKKGIHDFVNLSIRAREIKELEFYLIGPKNDSILQIEEEIKTMPDAPEITCIDYIADSVQAISKVDIVVSLSQIGESFGRSVMEGMAAGRLVIAYDRGAMSELINDGENGYLIEPNSLNQIIEKLNWLTKHRVEAKSMGDAGRKIVINKFSFEHFQATLKGIYQKIVSSNVAGTI